MVAAVASLVIADEGFAQQAPTRTISEIVDGVYRATNNNHGTVFMVTSEGIVLADPITHRLCDVVERRVRCTLWCSRPVCRL